MIKQKGVITIINEPTYIEDLDGLISKYSEELAIKDIQGVKFDIRRIKDKRYVVKKLYQILTNPNNPTDANSFQWRVRTVSCLENLLNTQFTNTRDFKRKTKNYLKNYEVRKKPVTERIKKARKKNGWTQRELAKQLGFKSHVAIVNYEKGKRYPPRKVFQWLEEQGM